MPFFRLFDYLSENVGRAYHVMLEVVAIHILLFGGIVLAFTKVPLHNIVPGIYTVQSLPTQQDAGTQNPL